MGYLKEGKTEDFSLEPMQLEKSEYADTNTFKTEMLKMFVENKLGNIQFTPQLRDGLVSFRVERTEEMTEYLRDKGLIR